MSFDKLRHRDTTSAMEMAQRAAMTAEDLLADTRSALLLVDVQNRFIFGKSEREPDVTVHVLEPITRLLATCRALDIPRFYVVGGHQHGADSGPWLRRLKDLGVDVYNRARNPPGPGWGSEIPAAIAPKGTEVQLKKLRFSAFFETGLEPILRGTGVETLIICGVASYGCIIATYLDACTRGFYPILCTEGVGGTDAALHASAMDFMGTHSRLSVDAIDRVWQRTKT